MHSRIAVITRERLALWLLLACVLLGQSGCATKSLWDGRKGESKFRPSHDAKLQLHAAPFTDDVLVQYEERKVSSYKPRMRAYFLLANATQVAAGKAPVFVDPKPFKGLQPISIHKAPPAAPPAATYYAVLGERPWEFELRREAQNYGVFRLPIYDGDRNTVPALLTPAALAVDAATGATYVAIGVATVYGILRYGALPRWQ